ncbi:nuclear transport factor 2 family protein [Ekhidna sp. MALMAid0563]|uniref:nuclear transport factor 2 family protein n=1 Tax=Ekhidna sp. MALMAid0563 TaxID=3143937 RepID=UPI0032DEBCD8
MNKLVAICLILVTTSCTKENVPSEKNLVAAIVEFNQAYKSGNVDRLTGMITNNYVHTNASWKSFGKETWLGYMEDRSKKINNGTLVVESYEMDELSIEMHNDTAIVTAKISTAGSEDGEPFNKNFRVTNIWVFDGSRWLRAGFHDTHIQ